MTACDVCLCVEAVLARKSFTASASIATAIAFLLICIVAQPAASETGSGGLPVCKAPRNYGYSEDAGSAEAGVIVASTMSELGGLTNLEMPLNKSSESPVPLELLCDSTRVSSVVPLSHSSDGVAPQEKRTKESSSGISESLKPTDFGGSVYYRNKLEFGLDVGYLPINIPFVFDVFLGDAYNMTPLRYTLVPIVASLRWHINDVSGPWIFRGNWDMTVSGSFTAIPRGPETRYYSYDMGIRRNFVPHRGKIAPYFDGRLGLGNIDAKEPLGVAFSQGQNFTFTMNLGSGVRYNFSPRYSLSAGLNWMHISNLYLSEPKFLNYGINVYGPMVGLDVRLGKPHRDVH